LLALFGTPELNTAAEEVEHELFRIMAELI
jgi:hypothetical protein